VTERVPGVALLNFHRYGDTTWDQVRDRLRDVIEPTLDAYRTGDGAVLFRELNHLIRRWAQIRQELD
jgi:hypothetical protein